MSAAEDIYWKVYDKCLDVIRDHGATVDDVIRILLTYWPPSSGDAFFPGGGDRTLVGVLLWERDDWYTVWAEADYYCCLRDSQGGLLSYIEGDVERGDCKGEAVKLEVAKIRAAKAENQETTEVEPWHGKAGEEQRQ